MFVAGYGGVATALLPRLRRRYGSHAAALRHGATSTRIRRMLVNSEALLRGDAYRRTGIEYEARRRPDAA